MENKINNYQLKKGDKVLVGEPFFRKEKRLGKVIEVRRHDLFYVNVFGYNYSDKPNKYHEVHINSLEPIYFT